MGILMWILFGLIVGWIASIIMHTKRRGLIRNLIIGVIGAFIGGWIASLFNLGSLTAFTVEGFIFAVLGAMLLIWVLRLLKF